MNSLHVRSSIAEYKVFFEQDFSFLERLSHGENQMLVLDRKVYQLYKNLVDRSFRVQNAYLFDAVEENKSLESVADIYDFLTASAAKRNLTVLCIGGGITQDVTGFAASTLYRGVRWIFVPTTFLAQTDSCIGAKTSLNFRSFKNLIGTFWPPVEVYVNTMFLRTLTKNDFYSGVGEAIKLQLMKEQYPKNIEAIVNTIEQAKSGEDYLLEFIQENLEVKRSYMENDEFDYGRRNLLNYGHCFGHALETTSEYYVPHGIAVNIGMIFANVLSVYRGMLDERLCEMVTHKLNLCNIPIEIREEDFNLDMLLKCMRNDKKRVGKDLAVVIPNDQFRLCKVTDVTEDEFARVLSSLKGLLFRCRVTSNPKSQMGLIS